MNCSIPASRASSTACWISGRSTRVSISFGIALVAGRKRVPRPATGNTALRTRFVVILKSLSDGSGGKGKGIFHRVANLLQRERLGDDTVYQGVQIVCAYAFLSVAGNHHNTQIGEKPHSLEGECNAGDVRHDDVGDEHVKFFFGERIKRLLAVGDGDGLVPD